MGTITLAIAETLANGASALFDQVFVVFAQFTVPTGTESDVPLALKQGIGKVLQILYWVGVSMCIITFVIGAIMWGLGYTSGGGPQQKMGKAMVIGGALGSLLIGLAPTVVSQFNTTGTDVTGTMGSGLETEAAAVQIIEPGDISATPW